MDHTRNNPVARFKEDPIHSMILDTLSKRPVNSDYYSLVKRINLSDYIKRPISADKLETIAKRSEEYMAKVGFAYGRLVEKNWVSSLIKRDKLRIHAPGPVISKFNDEEIEQFELPDTFKKKKLVGFQKAKNPNQLSKPTTKHVQTRVETTRPNTRVSASQRQARKYLNYLHTLTTGEHAIINTQICKKKQELTEKFEEIGKNREKKFNSKGIFSPELNKERVQSMIPVKMLSQYKVCFKPMMRNAKEIVMKDKLSEFHFEPAFETKADSGESDSAEKKERIMELIENTITKNQSKNRKKEASLVSVQKKVKVHWSERLNKSMFEIINKTRPDENFLNMPIL